MAARATSGRDASVARAAGGGGRMAFPSATNRLNASPGKAVEPDRREFAHERACLECGAPFVPRKSDAEFCAAGCRQSWNNRRLQRGAEVYDLLMALRWDRAVATGLHVFTALSRMAAGFRRQDIAERDGRRSWTPPAAVIARKPYLRTERLTQIRERADAPR